MNDRDIFAVWIAGAVLQGDEDEFAAEALKGLAAEASATGDLDQVLSAAATTDRRPGDIGLDFVGPLVPVILVGFGRLLWDAYMKALAEKGGKALADVTLSGLKELVRRTWTGENQTVRLDEAEARLLAAASRAGLPADQAAALAASLRKPGVVVALSGG